MDAMAELKVTADAFSPRETSKLAFLEPGDGLGRGDVAVDADGKFPERLIIRFP